MKFLPNSYAKSKTIFSKNTGTFQSEISTSPPDGSSKRNRLHLNWGLKTRSKQKTSSKAEKPVAQTNTKILIIWIFEASEKDEEKAFPTLDLAIWCLFG